MPPRRREQDGSTPGPAQKVYRGDSGIRIDRNALPVLPRRRLALALAEQLHADPVGFREDRHVLAAQGSPAPFWARAVARLWHATPQALAAYVPPMPSP